MLGELADCECDVRASTDLRYMSDPMALRCGTSPAGSCDGSPGVMDLYRGSIGVTTCLDELIPKRCRTLSAYVDCDSLRVPFAR